MTSVVAGVSVGSAHSRSPIFPAASESATGAASVPGATIRSAFVGETVYR
jgi:hypothetical protein